jgi:glycosyltransferase involved in cell wall biosynthesis
MQYRNGRGTINNQARRLGRGFLPQTGENENYPIIVHSHLDWDWVWQRPQQFLSRLSRRHRVLFVEGPKPVEDIAAASLQIRDVSDYPNVLVVKTHIPATRWNDGDWVDSERRRLLQKLLAEPIGRTFSSPVQWFYDPVAVRAFAGHMGERAIVYDCMDQLSQFRFAPPELLKRERELLALADVVFAGGPKIWKEKRKHNPNCFSFGCGVDVKHFARARHRKCPLPDDMQELSRPIFGYVGVIDERIDYELVADLAEANSTGSVVMVGPSTKVDMATLPRRGNLHWLGARDYSRLPGYIKAFDVCLMPFALNEATEFINPTKALEYMATGTPIVSTPVEDVVSQFSDIITIAPAAGKFIAACAHATKRPNSAAVRRGLKLAGKNSWDSVVRQLEAHVEEALTRRSKIALPAA